MTRWWWIGGGGLVVAGALATALLALGRPTQFTSSCPEAVAELQAGLDAEMKVYHAEAVHHFERASALDPHFVLAKVMLFDHLGSDQRDRREELIGQIASADLDRLTPRERLLARRALAHRARDRETADRLMEEYLAEHPDDPWVLQLKGEQAWVRGQEQVAESTYRRLLELNPNWAQAYNMLGYAAMRRGAFAEAEEHLTSYRFIAPGQANPHDSLGELFLLQGRLEEAADSFERALEIKPDFWPSHQQLIRVHQLRHDLEAIREVRARAEQSGECSADVVRNVRCMAALAELVERRAWEEIVADRACLEAGGDRDVAAQLHHRAACRLGRWELAERFEGSLEERVMRGGGTNESARRSASLLSHMKGVRHALQGNLRRAETLLRDADAGLRFDNSQVGLLKLENRLCLAEVLLARGHQKEGRQVVSTVRTVNPLLADEFEQGPGRLLGLG